MSELSSVYRIALLLGRALTDTAPMFEELAAPPLGDGLLLPLIDLPPVASALEAVTASAAHVEVATDALEDAVGADDAERAQRMVAFGIALDDHVSAFAELGEALSGGLDQIPDPADRNVASQLISSIAKHVADIVLIGTMARTVPELLVYLELLGLAAPRRVDGGASGAHGPLVLHLDRLGRLLSNPAGHFADAFDWGKNNFDPSRLFHAYRSLYREDIAIESGTDADGEPYLRHGVVTLRRDSSRSPTGLRVEIAVALSVDYEERLALGDAWGVTFAGHMGVHSSASVMLDPPLAASAGLDAGVTGGMRLAFDRGDASGPWILTDSELLGITVEKASAGFGMTAVTDSAGTSIVPEVTADLDGLAIRLGSDQADGFLARLLAGADIDGMVDLGLRWNPDDGLKMIGSGGTEIKLPLHTSLGVVDLDALYLSMQFLDDGSIAVEVTTELTAHLGPLVASVNRLGARANLRFSGEGDSGRPFSADLAFRPPSGVGLHIDAGIVAGGGFLDFDHERGRYSGAFELTIAETITVKAVGLITTQLPDGSPGFSLLVIMSAEFGSGLPLGFGFDLLGVGGLLGLHRTMRVGALVEGVRTGAIDSVMFPDDVVANAPRILSDLEAFFPVEQGTFLVGPMLKLGWGSPTLMSLSLGIIVEIPGDIAILGVLRAALPAEEAPVLVLQVNFVGVIELDRQRVYLFAALYESRVLFSPIEGELGVLVAFGSNADFVTSVGGFHPQFDPPPLPFPTPKRVSIQLVNTSVARVRVEGYFAITSNSAQFGARAEMFFGLSSISVEGHLAFDALFRFSPFSFTIDMSASMSVKVFGTGVFTVRVRGSLSGPTPWRAHGQGSIKILFVRISANFDVTWGESTDTMLPPVEVLPMLADALAQRSGWVARLPAASHPFVSLREIATNDGDDTLVFHPVGTLSISQLAVPLGLTLDRVGAQKLVDVNRLHLTVADDDLEVVGTVTGSFAPGQFKDMDDAERLSSPSFESMQSGIEISASGEQWRTSRVVERVVRYQEIIIDAGFERLVNRFAAAFGALFGRLRKGSFVAASPVSNATRQRLQPFDDRVAVIGQSWVLADQATNHAAGAAARFTSRVSAEDHLARQAAADPSMTAQLHVIPEYEVVS